MGSSQLLYVSIQQELFYQIRERIAIVTCKEVCLDSEIDTTAFIAQWLPDCYNS